MDRRTKYQDEGREDSSGLLQKRESYCRQGALSWQPFKALQTLNSNALNISYDIYIIIGFLK